MGFALWECSIRDSALSNLSPQEERICLSLTTALRQEKLPVSLPKTRALHIQRMDTDFCELSVSQHTVKPQGALLIKPKGKILGERTGALQKQVSAV